MTRKQCVLSERSAHRSRAILNLFIVSVCCLTGLAPRLSAQSVLYAGVPTTVNSGLGAPAGLAVDGNGNVYISYPYLAGGTVVQMPWVQGSGYGTPINVATDLGSTFGLAVDGGGNVYVAVANTSSVMEASPTGKGSWNLSTAIGSLTSPKGVAVDGQGDLYIADAGSHTVIEEPWTGSGYGAPSTLANIATSGNANFTPYGVAVDGSGNVFVADYGNGSATGTILEIPAGCTVAGGNCPIQLDYGMHEPEGITVDGNGNLFIADYDFGWILELPWTGIPYQYSSTHPPLFNQGELAISSRYYPTGVAVDVSGNVYFSDTVNNRVEKGNIDAVDFGSVSIGSASATIPVSFVFVAATTLGGKAVLTHGATGLDFTDAQSGTCTANTYYNVNDGCTVNVVFRPQSAGLRSGAAVLSDAGGNVIATAYLHGIGAAPQAIFSPGTQAPVVSSGLNSPAAVAVDAGGNLYIANSGSGNVVKSSGGPPNTVVGGLSSPSGVAVDGGGNVFVADTGNGQIVEVPWTTNSSYDTETTVVTGLSSPVSVAVDEGGNLYFADSGNHTVVKVPWIVSGYAAQSTLADATTNGSSFNPSGVAVDVSGDVFIADTGNKQVVEIPWTGSSYGSQATVGSGLSSPVGVAVDGGGNVYISDSGTREVVKVPWTGSSYGTQSTLANTTTNGSSFHPSGVAVDVNGNVYIADLGNSQVVKVDFADPPSLSFASTPAGSTSSDSPKTVIVSNIGNASLVFSSNPLYPANFSASLSDSNLCATGKSIAAGASCDVSADFIPLTAGSFSGQITLADNALAGGGTQYIVVSGAGALALSPGSLPAGTVGVTYSTTLTAGGGGGTYTFSVTGGALPSGLALSALGVLSGTPTSGGSFSVTITATDSITPALTGTQAYSLNIGAATITLSPATLPGATYESSYSQTLTASGGTSTYSFSVTSGSLPAGLTLSSSGELSGTPTAAGPSTFTVSATDSSTGTGPYSGSQAYSLTVGAAAPTLSLTCTEVIYDGNAHSCVGTATGVGGVTVAGTWSYSPTSATSAGSTPVTGTFTSSNGNYKSGTANGTLKIDAATPTINWATPTAVFYGTTLSSVQLDATASVPGTFVYSPIAGTTPPVGSNTLSVTFVPNDTTDYKTASSSVVLIVNPINPIPTITSTSPALISAAGTAFALTVNGSGFTANSTVYWGTSALATQYVSAAHLTAQVPAADIASAGVTAITVQTPAPGGGTSNAWQFEADSAGSGTTAPTVTPTTATVTAGATASFPVAFPSSVTNATVTCLNLPSGATCSYSFSTGVVTIATSSVTPAGTYPITLVFTETISGAAAAGILLPVLLLPLVVLRRKLAVRAVWVNACLVLVLMTALAFSVGCGGKTSPSTQPPADQTHLATSSSVVSLTIQ